MIAHVLAFALQAPDPHAHAALLRTTGHGSFWWLSAALIAGLSALLIGPSLRRVSRAAGTALLRPASFRLGTRLATMQLLGFALLEWSERGFPTASAVELLQEPVFLLGLVTQLVVAGGAAVFVRFTARLVRRVAEGYRSPSSPPAPSFPLPESTARTPRRWFHTPRSLRGPPVLPSL